MFRVGRYKGKLSPIEMLVLGSLKENSLFGNEIIEKLKKQFSETSFVPRSGTIYPIFERLETKNLIKASSNLFGKKTRKKYELTDEGRKVLIEILQNDDFEKEMAYSNKFFDFFFSKSFSNFIQNITEIGENIAEIGGNIAEGFEKTFKNLKLDRIKNEIRIFKKRIEYHDEQIDYHKSRIDKLSKKIKERELLLQNFDENQLILNKS